MERIPLVSTTKVQQQWKNEHYRKTAYHSQSEYSHASKVRKALLRQYIDGDLTQSQLADELRWRLGYSQTMATRAAQILIQEAQDGN